MELRYESFFFFPVGVVALTFDEILDPPASVQAAPAAAKTPTERTFMVMPDALTINDSLKILGSLDISILTSLRK
jgi:hypothetical protein